MAQWASMPSFLANMRRTPTVLAFLTGEEIIIMQTSLYGQSIDNLPIFPPPAADASGPRMQSPRAAEIALWPVMRRHVRGCISSRDYGGCGIERGLLWDCQRECFTLRYKQPISPYHQPGFTNSHCHQIPCKKLSESDSSVRPPFITSYDGRAL